MAIPPFTAGLPQNGQSLGNSKANIRDNIDGTFQTVAKNHFNNNSGSAGKHQYIQFPTDVNPGGSTGANELLLYNGLDGILNNLYFIPPGKAVPSAGIQLTRNESPITASTGFTWLPGGIIMQWGTATKTSGQTVSFSPSFLAVPYSVQITVFENNVNRHTVFVSATTTSNFTVTSRDSSGADESNTFFWLAIGK